MIGRTLSHFRITAKLGEGGMGAVYRAEDTALEREVAIKVLPEAFVEDAERLARFEREAKVLASLNHPNIAGIYEVGSDQGIHFLAMELAPGVDLADRLEHGPPTLADAVSIALQIATALEAAHQRGIVHRDLKPANIKIAPDGAVKVLDFGLAKAWDDPLGDKSALSMSPTLTAQMTQAGIILGTAGYMAPEQARGQSADPRADVWAFGVILWEMLTGARLFNENTVSDTLAAVLKTEIDPGRLPEGLPVSLRRLVERCLERDVQRRLQAIGEARIVLDDLRAGRTDAEVPRAVHEAESSRRRWIPVALSAGLLAAALALVWNGRDTSEPRPRMLRRVTVAIPNSILSTDDVNVQIALSPDGQTLVSAGVYAGEDVFYLRRLDSNEPLRFEAAKKVGPISFSPDGRWLAFNIDDSLFKASLRGGVALPIAEVGFALRGLCWSADGFIYYATAADGALFRVAAEGPAQPELVVAPDRATGDLQIAMPFALPSGKAVLVHVTHENAPPSIEVVDPSTGGRRDLGLSGFHPQYSESRIVFGSEGRVLAAPFDEATLEVVGEPVRLLADPVVGESILHLAVSAEGSMAYLSASRVALLEVVEVSLDGSQTPLLPGQLSSQRLGDPRYSPDGTRVLYSSDGGVSIADLGSSTVSRVDEDGFYPLWSPDGESLVHGVVAATTYDLVRRHADLRPEQEVLLDWDTPLRPADWSRHGFIFRDQIPGKGMDLKLLPADLQGEPQPLLEDEATELAPAISPDGRWLAFQSDQSGSDEIYVTSFPKAERRAQVSSSGGRSPAWSPDGSTLYYFEKDTFVAASITFDPDPRVVGRESLFSGNYYHYRWHRQYDVHPDGDRFLMIRMPEGEGGVELVLDWTQELAESSD